MAALVVEDGGKILKDFRGGGQILVVVEARVFFCVLYILYITMKIENFEHSNFSLIIFCSCLFCELFVKIGSSTLHSKLTIKLN